MNRYLEQLIEDMDAVISSQIAIRSHLDILGESELCASENELPYCEKVAPLSKIIGFDKCIFPPSEKLTDDQLTILYTQLLCVLDNFNFFLDFPNELELRDRYNLLLEIMDEETSYSNSKVTVLEFCDYDQDNCPFGEGFCQCKLYEERS